MKEKYLIVAVLIIALVASPVYLNISYNLVDTQDNRSGSKAYWRTVAKKAWDYFQVGKGVDATTGLHMASIGWPHFTEWDLGVYIQAIIDARKIGILSSDGPWGADARIEKILTFMENREISSNGLPYAWYTSDTGLPYGENPTGAIDVGKFLVALGNLKLFRPDLAERINQLVYERYNYSSLWDIVEGFAVFPGMYEYYVARGFAVFWPDKFSNVSESILDSIFSAPTVETPEGVELPKSKILSDPLLYSIFEIGPNSRVTELGERIYLAQEARYNATGKYTAFSEGNTGLNDPSYVFEWVVSDDGRTWVVDETYYDVPNVTDFSPICYFKAAVGFLALYNTPFTQNMVEYLEPKLLSSNGYMDGIDENGRVVSLFIDKTNGLVISSPRYALEHGDFITFPWQTGDLGFFPWPFIQEGKVNNTTIVIGETKPHGPVGPAQSADAIGGMLIAESLARNSSSGSIKAAIDDWLVEYDSISGNVVMLDNTTDLIVVGSPKTNSLSYYYNNLRDKFDEPLIQVQFVKNAAEMYDYLYVPSSGSIYRLTFDEQGNITADYGVIIAFQDQNHRSVIIIYGLGVDGTLGACQILANPEQWSLKGSAIIVKSIPDSVSNFPNSTSIVEVVY